MIKSLTETHISELIHLLKAARLPTEDIDLNHQLFIGFFNDNKLIGAAAIEPYDGGAALLRSVVVTTASQQRGLGRQLVLESIKKAKENNISHLFLLTETARSFFERLGFKVIERAAMPAAVQRSAEFSHLCPTTAICMKLALV